MSPIGYEVTLVVQDGIAGEYEAWLHAHVAQMLALPGFLGATVSRVLEPAPAPGETAFCCLYTLRDQAALDEYLRVHAAGMRADGVARFGDRFRASRRVLGVVATY